MAPLTLDDYMNLPWLAHTERCSDGSYRLVVAGLLDFELFAPSATQLEEEWRTALRSHLAGYLAVAKAIPIPMWQLQEPSEVRSSTGSRGQVVFFSVGPQIMTEPQAA